MTCIVAAKDEDGRIVMGADSCGSDGHRFGIYEESVKLFRVGPKTQPVVIGACGSYRLIDALRFGLKIPPRNHRSESSEEWIRTIFVEAVRARAKKLGFLQSNDGVDRIDGFALLATDGRLFVLQPNLSILESPPWGIATGSGKDAARGSLHTTHDEAATYTARERVGLALEAAEATIVSVRGPFLIEEIEAP